MTEPSTRSPFGGAPQPPNPPDSPLGRTIPLGKWLGVPVSAHWSVAVTLVLFAELLAASALPAARPGASALAYWLTGTITATVFLLTLLAHELAHAIVARHYRMRVRKITLWMLGGLTELDEEPPSPRADALIAFAGPATSLGLGGVFVAAAWGIGGSSLVVAALAWLAGVSALLGVFNLLPGTPLDGGRVLRAVLWGRSHDRARAQEGAARAGRLLGIFLIVLGILEVLGGAFAGAWLALVGWFIIGGAAGEAHSARDDRLGGLRAADVMTPTPTTLPGWWTVQQFLSELTDRQAVQLVFPVVTFEGHPSGVLVLADLDRVPAARRGELRLRDVVQGGRAHPLVVRGDVLLTDILVPMRRAGGIAVVVDAEGRPIGAITNVDLIRATRLVELGWRGVQASST